MAKKKKASMQKTPYPSRAKVKYVGIPAELYDILKQLAQREDRSASWEARRIIRAALEKEGLWPPSEAKED